MIELETEETVSGTEVSTRVVRVTGKGVWNPHHPHRVLVRSDGSMRLRAEATVLAARPTDNDRDQVAGTVAIGEQITINENVYLVVAPFMSDPILVPDPGEDIEAGHFAPEPRQVADGIDRPSYNS